MSTKTLLAPPPTVVVYDVMREASNRLRGRLFALERQDTTPGARERVLAACAAIQDRVDAVDSRDRDAIVQLDAELRAEFAALPHP